MKTRGKGGGRCECGHRKNKHYGKTLECSVFQGGSDPAGTFGPNADSTPCACTGFSKVAD